MSVRLSVIEIVVQDMGRSLAFYRLLGLDIPEGSEDEGHVEAALPGGMKVAWDTVATILSFYPDYVHSTGGMSLAFEAGSPAEVDAKYAELVAAGYKGEKEPWDAFWGQRFAVLQDPDGNGIDLFARL